MTSWQPTKLRDFFLHYDFGNPDHTRAVDLLQEHAGSLMEDSADWVQVFRGLKDSEEYLEPAVKLIKEFEGFRATPYLCPAGVWTVGYGSTYYPDGMPVNSDDPDISKNRAEQILRFHVKNAIVPILSKEIPTWTLMNSNQQAAIVSFAYNLGFYFYGGKNFQTITEALRVRENWKNVPAALRLYVNPGSSYKTGLMRRREAESELWMKTT